MLWCVCWCAHCVCSVVRGIVLCVCWWMWWCGCGGRGEEGKFVGVCWCLMVFLCVCECLCVFLRVCVFVFLPTIKTLFGLLGKCRATCGKPSEPPTVRQGHNILSRQLDSPFHDDVELRVIFVPKPRGQPTWVGNRCVRGLFSARVPRSSFARVRRVLITHMEDEDDQENEKEVEKEDGKQRVEGRVVENLATHNMQMTHV